MSTAIEKNSDLFCTSAKLKEDLTIGHLTFRAGEWVSLSIEGKGNIRKVNCWFTYRKFPITFSTGKEAFFNTFELRGVN
jgi:hypothetical protein